MEAVNVLKGSLFCLPARVPRPSPDQLCLDRFEESLNGKVSAAFASCPGPIIGNPSLQKELNQRLALRSRIRLSTKYAVHALHVVQSMV